MIEQRQLTALSWLHGKLKLEEDINLYYLIGNLQQGKYWIYYKQWVEDGRPIWEPLGELKLVQQKIAKILLSDFPRHPGCYGFSSGGCKQAVEKHVGFGSMMMFDLRHAFSQVTRQQVFEALHVTVKYLAPGFRKFLKLKFFFHKVFV